MKYLAQSDTSILEALTQLAPQSSKNTLRSWLKEGRVQIDGVLIKTPNFPVLKGQLVTVVQRKKFIGQGIEILYEDNDLVFINKPSGLLSVSTAFEKGETAHALLKAYYRPRKVFVIHRLDQDTSGVMIFAFNQETCDRLKDLFEVHHIQRSYTAIVEGQFLSPKGTWKSYLYEDEQYVVHETEDPSFGRLAITHYRTLAALKRYSLLELTLETGRKNQIRVHCQSAGHPVVGDKKYGAQTNPLKRLCLHAHLLAFRHPISKKELKIESPIPEEFYRLIPKN
ncbi:RluA family pseudouridine synthase [Candidatus Protochlamydia phocaeensis]|uniref:RluA family pseudouridine synthase n=1 Tax=Candidatus Protochlamydia phocaeensis TaxID=1414722 RepID=UPI000838EF19|nr:RluA family pseudouridine synthase [Candidatus Protochlamydia phocaeensis]